WDPGAANIPDDWPLHYAEHAFQHPSFPGPEFDVFQSNPWYDQSIPLWATSNDNRQLYYEPGKLRLGISNPPGTVVESEIASKSVLFVNSAHPTAAWELYQTTLPLEYEVNPR